MPPKTKYSKKEVLKAAMKVVEKKGLNDLTARSVARSLGSSTAPVYQHYSTMDELALAIIRETQKTLLEYSSRSYTDRVFLNMGTGIAMFALEHPRLYRALLLGGDSYGNVVREILDVLESDLVKDKRFTSLTGHERHVMLSKMWTFTHGLASLICVGLLKDCNQEYIIRTLTDVGTDVIGATLAKHAQNTRGKNHQE